MERQSDIRQESTLTMQLPEMLEHSPVFVQLDPGDLARFHAARSDTATSGLTRDGVEMIKQSGIVSGPLLERIHTGFEARTKLIHMLEMEVDTSASLVMQYDKLLRDHEQIQELANDTIVPSIENLLPDAIRGEGQDTILDRLETFFTKVDQFTEDFRDYRQRLDVAASTARTERVTEMIDALVAHTEDLAKALHVSDYLIGLHAQNQPEKSEQTRNDRWDKAWEFI